MPRKPSLKREKPTLKSDYTVADKLIADLENGTLADLTAASKRIYEVHNMAFEQGIAARQKWQRDRSAELAAENRRLREKLVSHSLTCDHEGVA